MKILVFLISTLILTGCFKSEYELKKYYRDPTSPAAQLMGGTFAGVVNTFDSLAACNEMKKEVENDDLVRSYTNSKYICVEKQ